MFFGSYGRIIPMSLGNATFESFIIGRASRLSSNDLPTQARRPRYIQKFKSKLLLVIFRGWPARARAKTPEGGRAPRDQISSLHFAFPHFAFRIPAPKAKKKARCLVSKTPGIILATTYSRTTYRSTTIGSAAFHFRVRNGNGWDHCAGSPDFEFLKQVSLKTSRV